MIMGIRVSKQVGDSIYHEHDNTYDMNVYARCGDIIYMNINGDCIPTVTDGSGQQQFLPEPLAPKYFPTLESYYNYTQGNPYACDLNYISNVVESDEELMRVFRHIGFKVDLYKRFFQPDIISPLDSGVFKVQR